MLFPQVPPENAMTPPLASPLTINNLLHFFGILIVLFATVLAARIVNKALARHFKRVSERLHVDETSYTVLRRLIVATIYVVGGIIAISFVPGFYNLLIGLAAGAGIAAIVLGFAAQSTLANFISGISLAIFRPFRVGDVVEIEGEYGTIEDITLHHTVIRTWQNKRLIIPNAKISEASIVNWSISDPTVLWFIDFGISYDSDIDLARRIIVDVVERHPSVLREREIKVFVTELGDFAVNLRALFWVKDRPSAWVAGAEIREAVKKRFDAAGIEIPFPYRTLVFKRELEQQQKTAGAAKEDESTARQ